MNCHKADPLECRECGCALRISSIPASLAPGTKARYAEGMCKVCWFLLNPEKVPEKPVDEVEEVTPEKLAHTIAGLEAYMARRRARLAVAS